MGEQIGYRFFIFKYFGKTFNVRATLVAYRHLSYRQFNGRTYTICQSYSICANDGSLLLVNCIFE